MSSLTSTCTSSSGLIKGQAQKLSFIGLVLAALTYGAHITLLLLSFKRIARRDRRLLLYVLVLFVLATVGLSMHLWWFDEVFNNSRQPYDAPMSFIYSYARHPSSMARAASYVMLSWFSEGLVLYRFYIIYSIMESKSSRVLIAAVSSFILILLVVGGGVCIPLVGRSGFPWLSSTCDIPAIVYLSTSSSIHAILTILIVIRILRFRRRVRLALGPAHGREYTSLAALLVESASLYTIWALTSVILCGLNSQLQFVFLPVVGQLQAIPPLLIITRVVEGRALSETSFSSTDTRSSPSLRFTSVLNASSKSPEKEKCPKLTLPYFASDISDRKSVYKLSTTSTSDFSTSMPSPLTPITPRSSPLSSYSHELSISAGSTTSMPWPLSPIAPRGFPLSPYTYDLEGGSYDSGSFRPMVNR